MTSVTKKITCGQSQEMNLEPDLEISILLLKVKERVNMHTNSHNRYFYVFSYLSFLEEGWTVKSQKLNWLFGYFPLGPLVSPKRTQIRWLWALHKPFEWHQGTKCHYITKEWGLLFHSKNESASFILCFSFGSSYQPSCTNSSYLLVTIYLVHNSLR